jgi:hypothetical protein
MDLLQMPSRSDIERVPDPVTWLIERVAEEWFGSMWIGPMIDLKETNDGDHEDCATCRSVGPSDDVVSMFRHNLKLYKVTWEPDLRF